MGYQESMMQQSSVRWFNLQYPEYQGLLFAVPNAGRRDVKQIHTKYGTKFVCTGGARLKAEGMVAGVSDLILMVANDEYHGLCLETKKEERTFGKNGHINSKKTYQSTEQKEWQQKVEKQGYKYVVYRSVEDFMYIVSDYLRKVKGK